MDRDHLSLADLVLAWRAATGGRVLAGYGRRLGYGLLDGVFMVMPILSDD
jgi:hypothetical protein